MTPGLEQELLRRYVEQNDAEAFRELVENHRDMVFSVCKRILRNAADAEDAAQNSFLQLARKARRLKAPIAGWLHHIAVQISINMHKQNAARTARQTKAAALRISNREPTWDELQGAIDEVIARLPDRLRVPVILHYLEGRKQEEIAAELGITQSAVSKRLAHGIETLRKRLTKSGAILSGVALATLLAANSVEAAPATLTTSVGRMAYVGLASGSKTATVVGGLSALKWGIMSAVGVAVIAGGVVVALKPSHESPPPALPVIAAQPAPEPVALRVKSGPGILAGIVLLPDGQPAANATVKLFYCHDSSGYGSKWLAEAKADAQGAFALRVPEFERPVVVVGNGRGDMTFLIVASLRGCAAAIAPVDPKNEQKTYTMRLHAGRDVRVVVNAQGAPVKDADVVIADVMLPESHWIPPGALSVVAPAAFPGGRTDERGEVVLRDVPASHSAAFAVRAVHETKGRDASPWSCVIYPSLPEQVFIRLALHGSIQIVKGRVLTDADMPLEGMLVYGDVSYRGSAAWWALTDKNGEFALRCPDYAGDLTMLVAVDPSSRPKYAPVSIAWPAAANDEPTLRMTAGTPVLARIREERTGKGLSGALLSMSIPGAERAGLNALRLSDANGECYFRAGTNRRVGLAGAPQGRAFVDTTGRTDAAWDGERAVAEFDVALVPTRNLDVLIKMPDGTSPAQVHLIETSPRVSGYSSSIEYFVPQSHVLLRDVPLVEGTVIYARSIDPSLSLAGKLDALKDVKGDSIELVLKPAPIGEVEIRDDKGEPMQGTVAVRFKDGPTIFDAQETQRVAGGFAARIPCLLPDMDYWVSLVKVRLDGGAENDAQVVRRLPVTWRFGPDEPRPKLVLTYAPKPGRETVTPKPRTEEDFKSDCETLAAVSRQQDPVQKGLTWYALKEGVALGNAKTLEVKSFRELLGESDFVASSIAFGQDKVWLGTNKGLFAWDRKDMFWTRFAVGGKFVDLPVRGLSLTDTGKLLVTIERDAKSHKFEYDTKALTWRELP